MLFRSPLLTAAGLLAPSRARSTSRSPNTGAIRSFPSGVINDYITWLVTGVAALGGMLALIIR